MVPFDDGAEMMTGSKLKAEREEFEALFKANELEKSNRASKSKYEQQVYTSEMKHEHSKISKPEEIASIEEKKSRREVFKWNPDPILLERF